MREYYKQENTSFPSPLSESCSREEICEPVEEPDQRRFQIRKECALQCLARHRPYLTRTPLKIAMLLALCTRNQRYVPFSTRRLRHWSSGFLAQNVHLIQTMQSNGNMEGKEVRFGVGGSVLTAVVTSNGATDSTKTYLPAIALGPLVEHIFMVGK